MFSHFLYRGLSGHAVEQDGVISFDSLKRYVQQETANWTLQHLDKTQKPFTQERGDNFGVFVLGQTGNLIAPEKGDSGVTDSAEVIGTYYDSGSIDFNLADQKYYVVKENESIFDVMRATGKYWRDIVRLNNLQAPNYPIAPGDRLRLE